MSIFYFSPVPIWKNKFLREICLLFIDKNNIIALTMDEWNLFSLFAWFSNEFLCTRHVLQWFCVKNIGLVMNMIEKIKSKVMRKFVFNTETLKLWFFLYMIFHNQRKNALLGLKWRLLRIVVCLFLYLQFLQF